MYTIEEFVAMTPEERNSPEVTRQIKIGVAKNIGTLIIVKVAIFYGIRKAVQYAAKNS